MHEDGHTFFVSNNGVWLTEGVPSSYHAVDPGIREMALLGPGAHPDGAPPLVPLPEEDIDALLWMLIRDGKSEYLRKGATDSEIVKRFGPPTAEHRHGKRPPILRFDAIELLFDADGLWALHCEFGSPFLPDSFSSERLGITPGPFRWPLALDQVVQIAARRGLPPIAFDRYGMAGYSFGQAELLLQLEDDLVALSISLLQ